MNHNEEEKIKKLIKRFDIELISLEYDIPIEELKILKNQMDSKISNPKKNTSTIVQSNNRSKSSKSKLENMREKYRKLYYGISEKQSMQYQKLSQEEIDKIGAKIVLVEKSEKAMKGASKKDKIYYLKGILNDIKEIKDYQLTVEQSEKFFNLLHSEEINILINYLNDDKLLYRLKLTKMTINRKLGQAIDIAQSQIENLDELKRLKRRIIVDMEKEDPIFIGGVKRKIDNKIQKIQQKNVIEKLRNNIPDSISEIVGDVVGGLLDIEKANEIIEEEVQRKVKNNSQNKFPLTEEQEKRQLLVQIQQVIVEKADKYKIKEPKTAVVILHELCGGGIEQSINTVVENLIANKDFEIAKDICNEFSKKSDALQIPKHISNLQKRIRSAEISDMVLKVINMNIRTPNEEAACFELIEKGLKSRSIKLESISLGKSQDGLRNITLADIWPNQYKSEMVI